MSEVKVITKQEEIREGVEEVVRQGIRASVLGEHRSLDNTVEGVLQYLHSKGVVIKVDREVPKNPYEDNPYDEYANAIKYEMVDMKREGFERCLHRIRAGYTVWEPLTKEPT